MARITKTAATVAAAAPAAVSGKAAGKVAKLDKAAQVAPAGKAPKADKAPKAEAAEKAPRRSQWHGLTITRTEAGKAEAPARNGALLRFNAIVAHKSTTDAIGSEYVDTDGSTRKVTPADIAYLVKRGLIETA